MVGPIPSQKRSKKNNKHRCAESYDGHARSATRILSFDEFWQVVLALIFLFGVASLLSCKDRMSTYLLYSDMAAKFDAGLATHVQCFCRKDCCGPSLFKTF